MGGTELIRARKYKLQVLARAHAKMSDNLEGRHWAYGLPVVVLTTLVGTSSFANVADLGKTRIGVAVVTGGLSMLAAVLAAVQTFYNFNARAQKHAVAAAELNSLDRRLDRALIDPNVKQEAEIAAVDDELAKIIKDAPRVSEGLQNEAMKVVDLEWQQHSQSKEKTQQVGKAPFSIESMEPAGIIETINVLKTPEDNK